MNSAPQRRPDWRPPATGEPRSRRGAWWTSIVATAWLVVPAPIAVAQDDAGVAAPASPLVLEALEVEPAQPAADTLCRLRVRLANGGDRDASALAFTVRINGQELPVYRQQLFLQAVPAGGTATVSLYNFWTTESTRSAPEDGRLRLEVILREAQWMQIGDDEEGVEVWQPLGAVEGLPARIEHTIELRGSAAKAG